MDGSGYSSLGGDLKPGGILRIDINKPRRSSGSSVEFRCQPERLGQDLNEGVGPASPQPSVDRLSVTWADAEDTSTRVNLFTPGTPPAAKMEVRFPEFIAEVGGEASEDEDYSASVSAIMQRRASARRSKRGRARRPSSPFSPDPLQPTARRRSSAFTTSSAETAISMEETPQEVTQEQIYENIGLHKEVLSSVKQQPWAMRRKLRLVSQAKAYIKRHEGVLQERLAQNKCTRDILARFNIILSSRLTRMKREAANISNWVIPWELRIKEIESHFGSVVASYFTFLRWLFWVNLVISVVLIMFVVVPEVLTADLRAAGERKEMLPDEKNTSSNLLTLWEFEGILKYSPIFYGYYTNREPGEKGGYRLPLAYFMTGVAVYIYSFVATLRKMAENSRMSKLSEKEDECIFSWKLFTGWDYMIGNTETAHNRTASIILGFKEALLEEAEKKKVLRNWKIIFQRVIVNACVIFLLGVSAYAVVEVVRRSNETGTEKNWWRQNEITIVMSLISYIFPIFFELLGIMENYHPRKQLRIQLARIMVLNLLNLYSLIIALFDKITDMTKELQRLKPENSTTTTMSPFTTSTTTTPLIGSIIPEVTTDYSIVTSTQSFETTEMMEPENFTYCYDVEVNCTSSAIMSLKNITATLMTIIFANNSQLPYDTFNSTISLPNTTFDSINITFSDFTSSTDMTETDYFNSSSNMTPYNIGNFTDLSSTPSDKFYEVTEENYAENTTDDDYYQDNYYDNDESNLLRFQRDANTMNDNITYIDPTISNEGLQSTKNTTEDIFEKNETYYSTEYNENITIYEDYNVENQTTEYSTTESFYTSTDLPYKSCFITQCINMTSKDFQKMNEDNVEHTTEDNIKVTHVNIVNKMKPSYMALIQSDYPFEKANSLKLDIETRRKLRKLCWETMFGQELVKLTMMDLVLTILATLFMDFFRAVFVRFMNRCWCWDLEKKFPQYGDFKIAENILHLVNNQGMVWMGMFFSPGLVVINLVKLVILMYVRSWAVMTCNVPHEVVFRASRSNNFYLALLLTMLFLCVLPVGYAIVWVEPSWHCGPFSNYQRIYHLFTQSLLKFLPEPFHRALDYIASPGIVIPLLVLLILIIYYLLSLTGALREANNDLKIQLRRERTEERRKMFQIADKRRRGGSNDLETAPFAKWKKILPVMPTNKAADILNDEVMPSPIEEATSGKKDLLSKIVKLALRKSSGTSEDESCLALPPVDDETDTEFHESLPEDVLTVKDIKFTHKKKKSNHSSDIKSKSSIENENNSKKTKRLANLVLENESENKRKHTSKSQSNKSEKSVISQDNPRNSKQSADITDNVESKYKASNPNISQNPESHHKSKKLGHHSEKSNDSNESQESKTKKKHGPKLKHRSLSASIEKREDSITSIIPVITISKTESDEDILDNKAKHLHHRKKHEKKPKKKSHNEDSAESARTSDGKSQDSQEPSTSSPNKMLKRQKSVESVQSDRKHDSHIELKDNPTSSFFSKQKKKDVKRDLVCSLLKAAKEWRESESPQEATPDKT